MKAKEFIPASKPRNFVAKNQKTAGAGAHRDKKKEQKQGYEKHKGQGVAEGLPQTLRKVVPGYAKREIDKKMDAGKFGKTDADKDANFQRYKKIQDKLKEQGVAESVFGIDSRTKGAIQNIVSQLSDIPGMWDHAAQTFTPEGLEKLKSLLKDNPKHIKYAVNLKADDYDESIMERDRDPEDWDEGNTEPPNNFAVYINGKKWKIFKGRGTYADDYREKQHYQQLKAWADKKSAATGKKWTVHVTGEMATEDIDEGWKDKLAAAALAGSMALGAGGAHGRTLPGADPEINRLTGKPNVTQVQKADDVKKTSNEQPAGAGFNSEYLKKVADGKHPRPMLSAEEAQQELERRGER